MAAPGCVLERTDAWLDDPEVVRREFTALIEANFGSEPPGTGEGAATPPGSTGPEHARPRTHLAEQRVPIRASARERGPPRSQHEAC